MLFRAVKTQLQLTKRTQEQTPAGKLREARGVEADTQRLPASSLSPRPRVSSSSHSRASAQGGSAAIAVKAPHASSCSFSFLFYR